jgi:hypothetical protein
LPRLGYILGVLVLGVALAGCSGGSDASSSGDAAHEQAIPARTPPPSTSLPVVTVAGGAPEVTQFAAPSTFTCLAGDPSQAQVTIGWNVPSATEVEITLDGATPASGIQDTLPYQVPAGAPGGPGVTIVFPCEPANDHVITLTWRAGSSAPTERAVSVSKTATA